MLELRVRNQLAEADLESKVGKVLGPKDYDVVLTGPTRVTKPDGKPLCVYLPGALRDVTQNDEIYSTFHSLRKLTTTQRWTAAASKPVKRGKWGDTVPISSAVIGAMDPNGIQKYCRMTAWTGKNMPEWQRLTPFFQAVARNFREYVPDRYAAQMAYVRSSKPEWMIPGTPFTTVTVNNTYPTGMHTDKGDLEAGFSTLGCLRRGEWTGGNLMFPKYRVSVSMQDGDLMLMDAHEWHANQAIVCECGERRVGYCDTCGAERISVVSYYRTKIAQCGTAAEEQRRAVANREKGQQT